MSLVVDNPFRVKAFLTTFPIKGCLRGGEQLADPQLAPRIGPELLALRPERRKIGEEKNFRGIYEDVFAPDRIFLLDRQGNQLGRVGFRWVRPNPEYRRLWWHKFIEPKNRWIPVLPDLGMENLSGWNSETFEETLGETLGRIPKSELAYYVVVVKPGIGGFVSLVIYKPPREYKLKDWLQYLRHREKENLEQCLAELDTQAV